MPMSPKRKPSKIVTPPSVMEGGSISRVVGFLDGTGYVETWSGTGWQPSGARTSVFDAARLATPEELAQRGIPA